MLTVERSAQQSAEPDALQRPLRSRFRARLSASVLSVLTTDDKGDGA